MDTQVCESLAKINGDDEFKGTEFSEIYGPLFLSLMEESQGDESDDDDRLDSLIRSLEAEISGTTMDGYDELTSNGSQDGQAWNLALMDDPDYWASSCDLETENVNMDVLPSSAWDGSWSIDSYGGEVTGFCSDVFYVNNLKMDIDGFTMGDQYACISFLGRELSYNSVICD